MSEQKREMVHDTFINVHCIALSNLPWALAQAEKKKNVRQCVYRTECLRTRLAPPLIQIHQVVVYIVNLTFSDFHATC